MGHKKCSMRLQEVGTRIFQHIKQAKGSNGNRRRGRRELSSSRGREREQEEAKEGGSKGALEGAVSSCISLVPAANWAQCICHLTVLKPEADAASSAPLFLCCLCCCFLLWPWPPSAATRSALRLVVCTDTFARLLDVSIFGFLFTSARFLLTFSGCHDA